MTTWLEYFTEGLSSQLAEMKTKGEKAIKRDVLHEIIRDFNLNLRQKKALDFLIELKQIDNSTYQKICNTTKRTATRDLTDLVNLELLERHGEKKGTFYTLKLFV
jgi:predicted HTH transcriptional regulator